MSTENNELYGSVKTNWNIKNILNIDKLNIKPSMIQLVKEIKSIGTFNVKINLHAEVQSEIKIEVLPAEINQ